MTAQLLPKFNRFVQEGNIQSDYYLSAFLTEVNCRVKEIRILDSSLNVIVSEAVVNNDYEFSSMVDNFESPSFIKDNKVVGMTQEKFAGVIRKYNPTGIKSAQILKYSFKLVKEGQAWKFAQLEEETVQTKLLEL